MTATAETVSPQPPTEAAIPAPAQASWPAALAGYGLFAMAGFFLELAGLTPFDGVVVLFELISAAAVFIALIVLHGIAWHYIGTRLVGGVTTVAHSVRFVGGLLVTPGGTALAISLLCLAGAAVSGSGAPSAVDTFARLTSIWAIVRVISHTKRSQHLGAAKTTALAFWLAPALIAFVLLTSALGWVTVHT